MKRMHIDDLERVLTDLGACEPAMTWLRSSGCKTFEEAWNTCPRGAWLRWTACRIGDKRLSGCADRAFEAFLAAIDAQTIGDTEIKLGADLARTHIPMADVERALQARLEARPCC